MNARKEMKKALETFGKPLLLISKGKKIRAVGLFDKIKKTKKHNKKKSVYDIISLSYKNKSYSEKFSLWAYDYVHVKSVEQVICKNETFDVVTGSYDENIGCWRLIVKTTSHEPVPNLQLNTSNISKM